VSTDLLQCITRLHLSSKVEKQISLLLHGNNRVIAQRSGRLRVSWQRLEYRQRHKHFSLPSCPL